MYYVQLRAELEFVPERWSRILAEAGFTDDPEDEEERRRPAPDALFLDALDLWLESLEMYACQVSYAPEPRSLRLTLWATMVEGTSLPEGFAETFRQAFTAWASLTCDRVASQPYRATEQVYVVVSEKGPDEDCNNVVDPQELQSLALHTGDTVMTIPHEDVKRDGPLTLPKDLQ